MASCEDDRIASLNGGSRGLQKGETQRIVEAAELNRS